MIGLWFPRRYEKCEPYILAEGLTNNIYGAVMALMELVTDINDGFLYK